MMSGRSSARAPRAPRRPNPLVGKVDPNVAPWKQPFWKNMDPASQDRVRDMYIQRMQRGIQAPPTTLQAPPAPGYYPQPTAPQPSAWGSLQPRPTAFTPAPAPTAFTPAPVTRIKSIGSIQAHPAAPAEDSDLRAEVASLRAAVKALVEKVETANDARFILYGRPTAKVNVYDSLPSDGGALVHTYTRGGNWVKLMYPIERVDNGDLWMRTQYVDREVGECLEGWTRVRDEGRGRALFSDYSLYEQDDSIEARVTTVESAVDHLAKAQVSSISGDLPRRTRIAPAKEDPDFMSLK